MLTLPPQDFVWKLPDESSSIPGYTGSFDCVPVRCAGGNSAQDDNYARDRYAPSDVSTRIFSPSLMNGGTCTTSPVSVFAALVTLLAVADFNPGSVSTTVSSTVCGNSTPTAFPSKNSILICRLGIR